MGSMRRDKKPRRLVAQPTPNRSYTAVCQLWFQPQHVVSHTLDGEQGEYCPKRVSKEAIRSHRRSTVQRTIYIYHVHGCRNLQAKCQCMVASTPLGRTYKKTQVAPRKRDRADCQYCPVCARICRPSEPEEPNGNSETPDHRVVQSVLWLGVGVACRDRLAILRLV